MKMEELSKETLKGFAADYEKDQEPIKDFFLTCHRIRSGYKNDVKIYVNVVFLINKSSLRMWKIGQKDYAIEKN
ncbi:hypothetical protein JCM19047_1961 [Bacillus sp. JCM 19047]|nr:hypothetical protein JCM19047_1961 [Bacillus sp. JCM 19047]